MMIGLENYGNPIEEALNNFVIVTEILKNSQISAKQCRLVSPLWNEVILSLPKPKLNLLFNSKNSSCCDATPFKDICATIPYQLARSIKLDRLGCTRGASPRLDSTFFTHHATAYLIEARKTKLLHICDKYGPNVDEISGSVDADMIPSLYHVLATNCRNLRHFGVNWHLANAPLQLPVGHSYNPPLPELVVAPQPTSLPPLYFLTSLQLGWKGPTYDYDLEEKSMIYTLFQLLIDASPNLLHLNIHPDFYPLTRSLKLKSITILSSATFFPNMPNFSLDNFSHMLKPVSGILKEVKIQSDLEQDQETRRRPLNRLGNMVWPEMRNLTVFRNDWTNIYPCHDVLERLAGPRLPNLKTLILGKKGSNTNLDLLLESIPSREDPTCKVSHLVLVGLHDWTAIFEIQRKFPHLDKLEITGYSDNSGNPGDNPLRLGPTLWVCVPLGLKHLAINVIVLPEKLSEFVECLMKSADLFKTLKTLEIGYISTYDGRNRKGPVIMDDLNIDGLDRMKRCLKLMKGLSNVVFDVPICFGNGTLESIRAFLRENGISVKFKNVKYIQYTV